MIHLNLFTHVGYSSYYHIKKTVNQYYAKSVSVVTPLQSFLKVSYCYTFFHICYNANKCIKQVFPFVQ